jgi:hypothetical protein
MPSSLGRRLGGPGIRRGIRGAGGGSRYDPATETGVVVDLWADSGVTVTSGRVSAWVDRKGGVSFTQGTAILRPVHEAAGMGGRSTVTSSIGEGGLGVASLAIAGTTRTVYAFGDYLDATTVTQCVCDSQTGRAICMQTGVGTALASYYDGAARDFGAAQTGKQCLSWMINGATVQMKRGSTSLGTLACSAISVSAKFGVLANFDAAASSVIAKMGRVIIANVVHDEATQARIRAWGVAYYGVGA